MNEIILMIKNCDIKLLGEMHFFFARYIFCLRIVQEFRYSAEEEFANFLRYIEKKLTILKTG